MTRSDKSFSAEANKYFRVKTCLLLAVIILFGGSIRIIGINHGAPDMVYHPDVAKQSRVTRSIYLGDLDLRKLFKDNYQFTIYPFGTSAILGRTLKWYSSLTGSPGKLDQVHRWVWALRMRCLSVIIFLIAITILLLAMSKELGAQATVITGLLLVLEPVNAQYSHYGMNDVPLASMLLLSWICSIKMRVEKARVPIFSVLTGLFVGISFGIKYQGILGFLFPLVLWCIMGREKGRRWLLISISSVILGFIAGSMFTSPLLLSDPKYFFEQFPLFMQWQSNISGRDAPFFGKLAQNIVSSGKMFIAYGFWLFLPAMVWAAFRLWKRDGSTNFNIMMLSALAFILVMLSVVVVRDFVRLHDILSVTVFMILLFGMMLSRINSSWGSGHKAMWKWSFHAIAIGLILFFAVVSTRDSLALAREDTRMKAWRWCQANIEPGSRVLRERYTLRIAKDGVIEQKFRYLSSKKAQETINSGQFDYLLSSSLSYDRFFDNLLPYYSRDIQNRRNNQMVYEQIRKKYPVKAVFKDRKLLFAHPTITVYARE